MNLEIDVQGEQQEARAMAIEYWTEFYSDNFNYQEHGSELIESVTQHADYDPAMLAFAAGNGELLTALSSKIRSQIVERLALNKVNGVDHE